MSKPVVAILVATLVTGSASLAGASAPDQVEDRAVRATAAPQSDDTHFGVVGEIDVRGLSSERKAALISGLPMKLGEPISKGQCKRVGDYVRSFDEQLRAAFVREDDRQRKAVIIIYRAR